ncbi:Malic enzyme [Quillaja saponaria]|uniref:Malic enzyme n=1 Tax=Quillaja saponaria TaxID=32244 RepID=A0AAD7PNR6_QUISA|nr:Malic enzyme [Quillaja saponaria]
MVFVQCEWLLTRTNGLQRLSRIYSPLQFAASNVSRYRRFSTAIPGPCIVQKRGADILNDPWFNKDTGLALTERDRLGLRGLLPPRVISFEQLYARFSSPSDAGCI